MLNKLPLAVVITFVFGLVGFAQEATPSPSPAVKPLMTRAQSMRRIIATERRLWEAWKSNDIKPFRANLSRDSVMIGDSGVTDKETSLKQMSSVQCKVNSYELSDIKVTFLDNDAALITYKVTQDATCGGQAVPPAVWASSAYVRRLGRWMAASHQETPAK